MRRRKATPERLMAFSDGVIAVIITIMVLELKPPEHATLQSLLPLWPIFLSYCVSYLFTAIIWVNHHHLLRFTEHANPALIWSNFAFLFAVSLLPFSTAWLAETHIAPIPVAVYALVFCLVNVAYLFFQREVLRQPSQQDSDLRALRRRSNTRAFLTLFVFVLAGLLALHHALLGFALIFANTLVYLLPEAAVTCGVSLDAEEETAQPGS